MLGCTADSNFLKRGSGETPLRAAIACHCLIINRHRPCGPRFHSVEESDDTLPRGIMRLGDQHSTLAGRLIGGGWRCRHIAELGGRRGSLLRWGRTSRRGRARLRSDEQRHEGPQSGEGAGYPRPGRPGSVRPLDTETTRQIVVVRIGAAGVRHVPFPFGSVDVDKQIATECSCARAALPPRRPHPGHR